MSFIRGVDNNELGLICEPSTCEREREREREKKLRGKKLR